MIFDEIKSLIKDPFTRALFLLGMDQVRIESGAGPYLITNKGDKILDLWGAYGASAFGYNHHSLIEALTNYLQKGHINLCFPFVRDESELLKENLLEVSGFKDGSVFFTTGGSETIDVAIRIIDSIKGNKGKILCFTNSFHGKTIGALSISNQKNLLKNRYVLKEIEVLEYNNIGQFKRYIEKNHPAGVFLEPIQANGGIIPIDEDFILGVSQICRHREIPLVLDEVSTGLGRTGEWFAFQRFQEVRPDILCVGKHLGGGLFPLGACIVNPSLRDKIVSDYIQYSTTFSQQGLAHLIANRGLKIIKEEGLLKKVDENGRYLIDALVGLKKRYPDKIKDVRGAGLIIGIEISHPYVNVGPNIYSLSIIRSLFVNKRILVGITSGDPSVLRLHPPFIIEKSDIDLFISGLEDILNKGKLNLIKDMGIKNLTGLLK